MFRVCHPLSLECTCIRAFPALVSRKEHRLTQAVRKKMNVQLSFSLASPLYRCISFIPAYNTLFCNKKKYQNLQVRVIRRIWKGKILNLQNILERIEILGIMEYEKKTLLVVWSRVRFQTHYGDSDKPIGLTVLCI